MREPFTSPCQGKNCEETSTPGDSLVKFQNLVSNRPKYSKNNLRSPRNYVQENINTGKDLGEFSLQQRPPPQDLYQEGTKGPSPLLKDSYIQPTRLKRASNPILDHGPIYLLETSHNDFSGLESIDMTRRNRRRVADNPLNKEETPSLSPSNNFVTGRKQSGVGGPNIDSIIQGIMKLLGGNVKLTATESDDAKLVTFGNGVTNHPTTSRINNRGPPRIPVLPFGILPPGPHIRPPVTPPTDKNLDPNKPQFVANTRPPFLVPLPPALSSRPTLTRTHLTGIPIPEDVLSDISGVTKKQTPELDEPTTMNVPLPEETEEANTVDGHEDESEVETEVKAESPAPPEETTLPPKNISLELSSDSSSSAPSLEPSISLISTSTSTTESGVTEPSVDTVPQLSSSMDIQNTLESSTISSNTISGSTITSTTTSDPFNLSDSVHPNDVIPIVTKGAVIKDVTPPLPSLPSPIASSSPPHTSKSTSFPSRTSHPSRPIHAFNNARLPTRLPSPIHSFATTGHRGVVLADTVDHMREYGGQLITSIPGGRPFGNGPEIFDVTVTALQGYGSGPQLPPSKYPSNQNSLNEVK